MGNVTGNFFQRAFVGKLILPKTPCHSGDTMLYAPSVRGLAG